MNIVLYDTPETRVSLAPLSFTRPIGDLRIGIRTIAEKWEDGGKRSVSFLTEDYLSSKFDYKSSANSIYIDGGVCPNAALIQAIGALDEGEALSMNEQIIAFKSSEEQHYGADFDFIALKEFSEEITVIRRPYDIFSQNDSELRLDFEVITQNRQSAPISGTNTLIGDEIFLEEGTSVEACILNSKTGPIYIGKNAQLLEGSIVRGGLALCEGAVLKMGAKIYGATTLGPFCKVGGEVSNVVFHGYSNKGHDGFLGNSVIGEWCNLGADTNTSNLKNNYAEVRLWHYGTKRFAPTGLQFCGLIMGDHGKCGINTMFNTGTVVGVGANIYGSGFPRNYIPSFAWGGAAGLSTFRLNKFFEVAEKVMERRSKTLDQTEQDILNHLFNELSDNRFWEEQKQKNV
jgi:UDP-N-acetylglucosamine diphosphorylase/glucosamine-1-phosphate N-acetyltransferase